MNGFDWIVVIICLLCAYHGWRVGGVFSIIFIFAGFIGSWVASNYYTLFSGYFAPHAQAVIYGYLCVFAMVLIGMLVAGYVVHKFVKLIFLGTLNRIVGMCLGIILGLILSAGIFLPLSTLANKKTRRLIRTSVIASHITRATKKVIKVFPPKRKKIFQIKLPPVIKKIEKHIKNIPKKIKKIIR